MAGRKRKPTAILKDTGGYRADRHGDRNEPDLSPEIPDAPDILDAAARAEWLRITRELNNKGVLTQVDRSVLASYCVNWSKWVAIEKRLQEEGDTVDSPNGYVIASPLVGIAVKWHDRMAKAAVELGFTPSSRSRVQVTKPKASGSPALRYLGGD